MQYGLMYLAQVDTRMLTTAGDQRESGRTTHVAL